MGSIVVDLGAASVMSGMCPGLDTTGTEHSDDLKLYFAGQCFCRGEVVECDPGR